MPIINRIGDFAAEMTAWRRWMHQHPELGFDCHKTAGFVVEKLREFGITEIHEGIATSGVVAIIEGQGPGPTIGLRADMDALPMQEATDLAHASTVPGKMHACGHDGHTTMLLGAAKYLAETRRFSGRVALIFQPAEEGGGGGEVMVQEGVIERFEIAQAFALHNAPLYPEGQLLARPGPIMAGVDEFEVVVTGVGGHAAWPHESVDPIAAAVAMIQSLNTIVSRNHNPTNELVLSITQIHTGTANNIIPPTAVFSGTIRSFDQEVRGMVFRRIQELIAGQAAAFGVEADLRFDEGYPPTINNPEKTAFAAQVAQEVVGTDQVRTDIPQEMGAEDFAYILNDCPGAYFFLGQGTGINCHHPAFDFNDEIAPIGASFFARLVERAQPLEPAHGA